MQLLFTLGSVLGGITFDEIREFCGEHPAAFVVPAFSMGIAIVQHQLRERERNDDSVARVQEVILPFRSEWEKVRPSHNPGVSPNEVMLRGVELLHRFKGEFLQLVPHSPEALRSEIRILGNESALITRHYDNGQLSLEKWEIQRIHIGQCIGRLMRLLQQEKRN